MGRPKNPNIPPADTTLKVRKSTLDELDKIVNYQHMPLGRKLESLIAEVKMHRKNLGSQLPTNSPRQELNALLVINNHGNESTEQRYDRELAELSASNDQEEEPDADETNNGGEDDEPEFFEDESMRKWEEDQGIHDDY